MGNANQTLEDLTRELLAADPEDLARRESAADRRAHRARRDRPTRPRRRNAARRAEAGSKRATPLKSGNARQDIRSSRHPGGNLRIVGEVRRLRLSSRQPGQALLHHDAAAQCHGQPAYGPRADLHAAGHSHPLSPHEGSRRAVAAGHRSCRHRDADGGRAPARSRAIGPAQARPRQIHRARLAMEGRVRRHDHAPAPLARCLARLVARALHDGRGALRRGAPRLRPAASRRPDLSRQAAGELGPEAAHRGQRSRSREPGDQGLALVSEISDRGPRRRIHHRRDDAARDDARRYRRRGSSRGRALQASHRPLRRAAAGRPAHSDRRRRACRSDRGQRRGEDHAGA